MVYHIQHEYGEDSSSWGFEWVDGDSRKVELVDPSDDGCVESWPPAFGRALRADFIPTQIRPTLNRRHFPDYFNLNGRWVSEAFRSVIEAFEPGVHQFFPVDVVNKRGGVLAKRYLFVVCNRIDSLDHEKTERLWWSMEALMKGAGMWKRRSDLKTSPEIITKNWTIPDGANLDDPEWYKQDKLVFDKEKIGGRHIWVDKHLQAGVTYVSNELYDALIAADFHEFGGKKFEEV